MKKRVRFIALLILVTITDFMLWKFLPWPTLSAKFSAFLRSDVPPVWYYSVIILLALFVMVLIWIALQVIPKRQALALQKTERKTVVEGQEIDEEGLTFTPQSTIKPTELFSIENEARKTLSQIIGGFIVIVSLIITGANLAVTSRLTQEGQITDRFTKAITQLGDRDKLEVRLGGIYALERIAKDSEEDHWIIVEILTTYVREHSPLKKEVPLPITSSEDEALAEGVPITKLPPDVQAILTVIGRRNIENEKNSLDLKKTDLSQGDLFEAKLHKADLRGSDLSGSYLSKADLSEANLYLASLRKANLIEANLRKVVLSKADLFETYLYKADLMDADLRKADLSKVRARNLTWEQISNTIIDDETILPMEIENQHKEELKAMREKTRKEREGK